MKKINILKSVLLGCALMFTASCGNDYELDDFRQPAAAPTQTTVTPQPWKPTAYWPRPVSLST